MIQSLLTQEEYDMLSKTYNTYNPSGRNDQEDGSNAPPNYTMGDCLSVVEIKKINSLIEKLMKEKGIVYLE